MFIQNDIYRHTQQLKMVLVLFICAMMLVIGCSDDSFIGVEGHQLKTLRPWVSQSFSQNHPISDAFFLDHSALSKEGIQAFLERSPYGRSWLADYTISGRSTSTMVHDVAKLKGVNPILLLSRMQVEASLISASNRPAQHLIDRAMGCGCHDGRACQSRYLGLENQIVCAAQKLEELYELSVSGSGWWRRGLGKRTLDNYWITPENHASAALYAYTPWVLKGTGGTWLAWKTAQLFDQHAYDQRLDLLGQSSAEEEQCGRYADVSEDHPGFGAIEAASHHNWIGGCAADRFCPEDHLTRAQAASVIYKALGFSPSSVGSMSDLNGHWAKEAVETVVSSGLMVGCTADLFCPDEVLSRAQAAVVIAKAVNLESVRPSRYSDIPEGHWSEPYISALADKGYIGGCSSDEFCLDASTRRWIFVTWLSNALQLAQHSCP